MVNDAAVSTPPRPWRALPDVGPLASKNEYIGLMSRPLNGEKPKLAMSAQSSPRTKLSMLPVSDSSTWT